MVEIGFWRYMVNNKNNEYNTVHMVKDGLELHSVFDFSINRHAPVFINKKDGIQFAVAKLVFPTEEAAMATGKELQEYVRGMEASAVFTGLVLDMNHVQLWPATVTDNNDLITNIMVVDRMLH